jgi:hypothetical protein
MVAEEVVSSNSGRQECEFRTEFNHLLKKEIVSQKHLKRLEAEESDTAIDGTTGEPVNCEVNCDVNENPLHDDGCRRITAMGKAVSKRADESLLRRKMQYSEHRVSDERQTFNAGSGVSGGYTFHERREGDGLSILESGQQEVVQDSVSEYEIEELPCISQYAKVGICGEVRFCRNVYDSQGCYTERRSYSSASDSEPDSDSTVSEDNRRVAMKSKLNTKSNRVSLGNARVAMKSNLSIKKDNARVAMKSKLSTKSNAASLDEQRNDSSASDLEPDIDSTVSEDNGRVAMKSKLNTKSNRVSLGNARVAMKSNLSIKKDNARVAMKSKLSTKSNAASLDEQRNDSSASDLEPDIDSTVSEDNGRVAMKSKLNTKSNRVSLGNARVAMKSNLSIKKDNARVAMKSKLSTKSNAASLDEQRNDSSASDLEPDIDSTVSEDNGRVAMKSKLNTKSQSW